LLRILLRILALRRSVTVSHLKFLPSLQVLVCGDRIGWRKNSRRVVIFTTDQSFHIGMDGKLGGIGANDMPHILE